MSPCHSQSPKTLNNFYKLHQVRRPDITKAKELLGWKPVVNREEGLKKVAEYFRKLI